MPDPVNPQRFPGMCHPVEMRVTRDGERATDRPKSHQDRAWFFLFSPHTPRVQDAAFREGGTPSNNGRRRRQSVVRSKSPFVDGLEPSLRRGLRTILDGDVA